VGLSVGSCVVSGVSVGSLEMVGWIYNNTISKNDVGAKKEWIHCKCK
jgi:hypothetical protein